MTSRFLPDWDRRCAQSGTYRAIFKWGAADRFKHPDRRLYQEIKQRLALDDDHFNSPRCQGHQPVQVHQPIRLSDMQLEAIAQMVGPNNIGTDDLSRLRFCTGQAAEEIFQLRQAQVTGVVDMVVRPRHTDDVVKLVAYCHQQRIPIQVCGGRTSVSLGLKATNGGIALDMTAHMNRLLELNEVNQTVTVQPGMMGPRYEQLLNQAPARLGAKRAYTGGHFPQSFEFSTVGGWIAALGSGQASTYYGDMADLVVSLEMVTPAGRVRTLDYPAAATGPRVKDMLVGSEGAFGVIVSATLKIYRHMPQNSRRFAFLMPDFERAVVAGRQICQAESGLPSILRISDAEETDIIMNWYGLKGPLIDRLLALKRLKPRRRCLLIGQADGERGFARHVARHVRRTCRRQGGLFLSGYPVARWAKGRYSDPYLRDALNDYGIVLDTLETSVTWERLADVHRTVRRHIKQRPHTLCMTHASHFYPHGTNLYFIFGFACRDQDDYRAFQRSIIDAIRRAGGSLSHHHGVGKMMAPWMAAHLGQAQIDVLKALKTHFDPHGIMNPGGTLGLDLPPEQVVSAAE